MSIEALKRYLSARELLAEGDRDGASAALEEAVGSQPDNAVIRRDLDRWLAYDTLPGEMMLELLRVEIQRKDDDN